MKALHITFLRETMRDYPHDVSKLVDLVDETKTEWDAAGEEVDGIMKSEYKRGQRDYVFEKVRCCQRAFCGDVLHFFFHHAGDEFEEAVCKLYKLYTQRVLRFEKIK